MIGLRGATRAAERVSRVGSLLGLVLLITAHLSGHTHTAAFDGSHLNVPAVMCAQDTTVDLGESLTGAPVHHHHSDGHIDHASDRPRGGTSADDGSTTGGHGRGGPALIPVAASDLARAGAPRDPPTVLSPYGRSALALHCVRRQ
ncbi:hypothetical protein [Streptomyces sp. cg40]|uniref:hypothetical protein n=1 Tax=Streptomyces sp. cg40 TaxID=3419764 RepID=UPI003D00FD66